MATRVSVRPMAIAMPMTTAMKRDPFLIPSYPRALIKHHSQSPCCALHIAYGNKDEN
jgi:hypothetical protein